ncbi:DUF6898 family protein [Lutibaculum baratangense]|uniref:DUF6898 domain-containing protein n=1 Tax=Lutibaculum baratangense AMV1 TaxID=631454 RepID=V4RCZ1_9HYPH|nr:hypothetical protein [Lutibaculum baratangense]ESR23264.1 hypothetical protein N177_3332 [Lutibaculum baratangense AMV1]
MNRGSGRPPAGDAPATGEIYLEYQVLGGQMRVAAIDAATGHEVTLVVPPNLPEADIVRLARRKLEMRRASRPDKPEPSAPGSRGRLA